MDFDKYIRFRTRMKATPAFDNVSMGTPENELFGTPDTKYRHFTAFSKEHSAVNGELADGQQIKMMNPMNYIADDKAVKAEHFRIRHGAVDRDTSLAISAMLTASLENHGVDVELQYPWGMPEIMIWKSYSHGSIRFVDSVNMKTGRTYEKTKVFSYVLLSYRSMQEINQVLTY